ncbi:hypothetical protein SLEP1_g12557 [Rubroshorea leprosula]|uniref:Uncharacterized protein n=1 Tax=Rubroshorea leprosula TaxID=152421 RepID=A0AAV5IIR3_9ROSI|nr:hypothetical protein SLEP1_g12557 [Rubroshorea leprosula]
MDSFRERRELQGNQGIEREEKGVISVKPITMIVPPALQDLPKTMTPESSASSSTRDNGGDHHTSSSSSLSSEETHSREEGTGDVVSNVSYWPVIGEWESKTITGRLSNLQKAPKDLPVGFRFKAALHHEVADSAPSISGYRKLEEMIPVYMDHFEAGLQFPLPGLIFHLLANYELALTQLTPNSISAGCVPTPEAQSGITSQGEKSQLFKNVRNKVARWKRQFIFVHDTRTERISNDLAGWLSEWRVPNAHVNYPQLLPRDMDLKNQLLEYAKREDLTDLDALVTSEQLVVFGFIDVANLFTEGEMSSILERQRQRAQGSQSRASGSAPQRQTRFDKQPPPAPQSRNSSHRGSSSASRPRADQRAKTAAPSARRRAREEIESEDEVPLIRRRTSGGTQPAQAAQTMVACSSNVPSTTARAVAEPAPTSTLVSAPRIAYPDGFNYAKPDCQPAMVQGMQSFVPLVNHQRAMAFVRSVTRWHCLRTNRGLALKITSSEASLVDDVNRLQGSEMANRAAAAETEQTSSPIEIMSSRRS